MNNIDTFTYWTGAAFCAGLFSLVRDWKKITSAVRESHPIQHIAGPLNVSVPYVCDVRWVSGRPIIYGRFYGPNNENLV